MNQSRVNAEFNRAGSNKENKQLSADEWERVCSLDELPRDAGVAALIGEGTEREAQIALFRVGEGQSGACRLYAISNFDPFSGANVLGRGILCGIGEDVAVASPIGKEHFSLTTGRCFEDDGIFVGTYPVKIRDGIVFVQAREQGGV